MLAGTCGISCTSNPGLALQPASCSLPVVNQTLQHEDAERPRPLDPTDNSLTVEMLDSEATTVDLSARIGLPRIDRSLAVWVSPLVAELTSGR